jgi:hypothetical protein
MARVDTTPAVSPGEYAEGRAASVPPKRLTNGRDLAKFTGLVALFAIFADAAVGHALLWENDPYWTYWITKTFLIATIFGLGTAWLGIGVGRGAVITAVHTVVLTVYYWSLSPIGLPSHPEWSTIPSVAIPPGGELVCTSGIMVAAGSARTRCLPFTPRWRCSPWDGSWSMANWWLPASLSMS